MSTDHLRHAALLAAQQEMRNLSTNAIAQSIAWRIVSAALDGYEDQMAIDLSGDVRPGWAIMVDGRPMLTVPTRRIARVQRRLFATLAQRPVRDYRILPTEVALARSADFLSAIRARFGVGSASDS